MGIYSDLAKKQPPTPEPKLEKVEPNASKLASKKTSKIASKQVIKQTTAGEFLKMKPIQSGGFRYPPALLENIDDFVYQIKKEHKVKITKNSLAVLGISDLLEEYSKKGNPALYINFSLRVNKLRC